MYYRNLFRLRLFSTFTRRVSRSSSFPLAKTTVSCPKRRYSTSLSVRQPLNNKPMSTAQAVRGPSPRTGDLDVDTELEVGLDIIEHEMTCPEFRDSVWGFVVYRCFEGHDEAWNTLLQRMRSRIPLWLEDESLSRPRLNLLLAHDLHVIDDPSLYGASISAIRAHFKTWVSKDLQARLLSDVECPTSETDHPGADRTPRYSSCLAVDENDLLRMDHSRTGPTNGPFLKLISLQWDYMQLELTHPLFFVGGAELDEEEGGWYSMWLSDYLDTYICLQFPDLPV
ncbi:hypothetical protein BKA61DRAFT_654283 [Leptodontidium sp. MPI-SDFR-AT-0119]|nr:hypothetical protein BKA61DRAFT_654283 [Leptodontidium sp. MPI-SDFR-AT-0119]